MSFQTKVESHAQRDESGREARGNGEKRVGRERGESDSGEKLTTVAVSPAGRDVIRASKGGQATTKSKSTGHRLGPRGLLETRDEEGAVTKSEMIHEESNPFQLEKGGGPPRRSNKLICGGMHSENQTGFLNPSLDKEV